MSARKATAHTFLQALCPQMRSVRQTLNVKDSALCDQTPVPARHCPFWRVIGIDALGAARSCSYLGGPLPHRGRAATPL